jgi:hypothetical protein
MIEHCQATVIHGTVCDTVWYKSRSGMKMHSLWTFILPGLMRLASSSMSPFVLLSFGSQCLCGQRTDYMVWLDVSSSDIVRPFFFVGDCYWWCEHDGVRQWTCHSSVVQRFILGGSPTHFLTINFPVRSRSVAFLSCLLYLTSLDFCLWCNLKCQRTITDHTRFQNWGMKCQALCFYPAETSHRCQHCLDAKSGQFESLC